GSVKTSDLVAFGLIFLAAAGGMSYSIYDAYRNPARDSRDECYHQAIQIVNAGNYPDGSLAALEVGALGYLTERPVVDLLGLTSPNPQYITHEHLDTFFADPPQLVLIREPPGPFLRALANDPRFKMVYGEGDFITIQPFPIRLYIRGRRN